MSDLVATVVFWVGVVLIAGFVVVGLASGKMRKLLQRPAEDMLRNDRERWGGPADSDDSSDQGGPR